MTPAQRKYDQDLIAAMRRMAVNIEPRSRQLSDTLTVAAQRLDALSAAIPVEPGPNVAQDAIHQPASTPDLHQRVRPARDYGG